MRLLSGALILGLVGTSTSGCYTTWDIAPRELNKLAGYREPARIPLTDKDGNTFEFNQRTELRVHQPNGSMVSTGPLASIDINGRR